MPFDETNFHNPVSPSCSNCKHFVDYSVPPVCKAFPNGIPLEILKGEDDHTQPVRGDKGIRWEKA